MNGPAAVVGAGLSGLMAARTLQAAGRDVVVFDKGRRPGGRCNTREHDRRRFDHGAQYFTIRDPRLEAPLAQWLAEGVVAEWTGTLVRISGTGIEPAREARRFVGVPGMVSLALHLAHGLDVRTHVRVGALDAAPGGWRLTDVEGGDLGVFATVVVAVPAAQAVPLLTPVPELHASAAAVDMAPCWAAMVVFDEAAGLPYDAAFVEAGPVTWMARDSSKPRRPGEESWVLHASPDWTRSQWETDRARIAPLLLAEARSFTGPLPPTRFERAHRWGYALAGDAPAGTMWINPTAGVAVCGDWTVGGRVEGALLSGIQAAEALLGAT